MSKRFITLITLLSGVYSLAQVGIGTDSPQGTLDVVGEPENSLVLDGILAPRLTGEQLRAKTYSTDQIGALVYVTQADTAPFGQTLNVTSEGYYYFDGELWVALANSAGGDGNNIYNSNGALTSERTLTYNGFPMTFLGSNERTRFDSSGRLYQEGIAGVATMGFRAADNDDNGLRNQFLIQTFAENSVNLTASGDSRGINIITNYNLNPAPIQFMTTPGGSDNNAKLRMIITGQGKVGITTNNPTEILDVDGTTRLRNLPENGSTEVIYTQPNGSASSTQNQAFVATRTVVADENGVLGYVQGVPVSMSVGAIEGINCSTAVLEPGTYTSGTPYNGYLKVKYTGGNGGTYASGATVTINGLEFKLMPGTLQYGSGELVFAVNGTPTVSNPTTITIPLEGPSGNNLVPFLPTGVSCNAIIGEVISAETTTAATVGPLMATNDPSPGYHRVVTSPDGKFSVRVVIKQGRPFSESDLQIRSNVGTPTIMTNTSVNYVTSGLIVQGNNGMTFPSAGVWYGNGGANGTIMGDAIDNAWGDPDVYYGSPEWRRYSWTTTDSSDPTMYILEFMLGAPSPSLFANETNCPNGVCTETKAYLRIIQVTGQ